MCIKKNGDIGVINCQISPNVEVFIVFFFFPVIFWIVVVTPVNIVLQFTQSHQIQPAPTTKIHKSLHSDQNHTNLYPTANYDALPNQQNCHPYNRIKSIIYSTLAPITNSKRYANTL